MLLATDVHYADTGATAAAVAFSGWRASAADRTWVLPRAGVPAPYEPGRFYKRELPHLLELVQHALLEVEIEAIIVDGHVRLAGSQPGLGMHLYEVLEHTFPVVGIAKSAYHGGTALKVRRGRSRRPLFVSAAGLDEAEVAHLVAAMHGTGRLPTMLRLVDRLARQGDAPGDPHPELPVHER